MDEGASNSLYVNYLNMHGHNRALAPKNWMNLTQHLTFMTRIQHPCLSSALLSKIKPPPALEMYGLDLASEAVSLQVSSDEPSKKVWWR